jgi:ABC-2 type transport system ATP-binding protein
MLQGGGGIDPRMTAREVVGLHARFHADPRPVDGLLELVGLTGAPARTRYRRLSGGERQRVGLALSLVGNPELVILDEPTAGMDVEARGATRDMLAELRASGVTILLTSHDLVDVERLADRLAILDRGRIVAIGTPGELTGASLPVIRFRLAVPLTEPDRVALGERLGESLGGRAAVEPDEGPGRYRVDGLAPSPAAIARLAAWCAARGALITDLRSAGGTLEERYLELTGAGGDESIDEDAGGHGAGGGAARRRSST